VDVSAIRAKLGIGPEAGVAWFSLDESDVGFAPHKSPGHRAVIVRDWSPTRPLTWVFARSKSSRNGFLHDPHRHSNDYPRCWLEERARIVLSCPLTVKSRLLDHQTSMCPEPDQDATDAVMGTPIPT
jgi:hypothetical protein